MERVFGFRGRMKKGLGVMGRVKLGVISGIMEKTMKTTRMWLGFFF